MPFFTLESSELDGAHHRLEFINDIHKQRCHMAWQSLIQCKILCISNKTETDMNNFHFKRVQQTGKKKIFTSSKCTSVYD